MENMEFGTLNFGATNFIGVYLLPEVIAKFYDIYPNITINMVINSSKNIFEMLQKNQLEFFFASDYVISDTKRYLVNKYCVDELKLIVGSKHPLFAQNSCSLFDVQKELYITKNKKSSQYRFLEGIFSQYGFHFNKELYISHQEAIKESVIHNIGISVMSSKMVEREVQAGLLSTLNFEETSIKRNIQYVQMKDKVLTPAAQKFLELVNSD